MTEFIESELLRIFIDEADRAEGKALYEVIVETARKNGLKGATVLRGVLGFGAESHLHSAKILRISENLPLVIEIVDSTEKIETFLPELDRLVRNGLVTVEKVRAKSYGPAGE